MEPEKKPHRGIYLLPNLFTTSALFAGFYAIAGAVNGNYHAAAVAIFIAMILDGLDGRVARLTNTQSEFGAQYDSLADLVSFGIAPAIVAYAWGLSSIGKLGWMVAFVYATCAALRLARFNVQLNTADKRYFQGLPSPTAAAVVAGFIWMMSDKGLMGADYVVLLLLVTIAAGLLMVSNVRYHSFKEIDLRGKVPFVVAVGIMLGLAVINVDPPLILFLLALGYTISGPILTFTMLRRRRQESAKSDSDDASGE